MKNLRTLLCTLVVLTISSFTFATTNTASTAPGAEQALDQLNKSPRHGEWADISVPGTTTTLRTWIVYPERKDNAPVVIVIHEIYGLTDWIRGVADQLAADGFIAVAPDLVTGMGPNGGGTESFSDRDAVVKAVRSLKDPDVTKALNAVRDHAIKIPAAAKEVATVGFCWGGAVSFRYATEQPDLSAAVVYYGTSPDAAAVERLHAPVLGLYGENDNRVNATIAPAQEKAKAANKTYEVKIYPGAGHGFLRQQDGQDGANKKAADQAWPETIRFLKEHTK